MSSEKLLADWPSGVAGISAPIFWWRAKQDNAEREKVKGQALESDGQMDAYNDLVISQIR